MGIPVDASWLAYAFLLLFRIAVGPFLPGYVHPDEFFQGGQELFYGCPPTVPWEFEPDHALRSVIPPTLMTWAPLQMYRGLRFLARRAIGRCGSIDGTGSFSGAEVLVVPRIACSLMSVFFVDRSVWSICSAVDKPNKGDGRGGVPVPVLLVASAWPTLVMMTRPFSNSMESYVFASLMATVWKVTIGDESSVGFFFCWKIGMLCALGIFTRFTFAFFAVPILLCLLKHLSQMFGIQTSVLWRKIGWMAVFFAVLSLGIVMADTAFYLLRRHEASTLSSHRDNVLLPLDFSSLVVTPFNALAYNIKTSNLKDHGLHPRWTHAIVNMLIMYGPLTLATYFWIATKLLHSVGRTLKGSKLAEGDFLMVPASVVLFGLGLLSIAPHQEPRFLLPLLVPLVLLGEKAIRRFPKTGACTWVLFNLVLLTLFGVLHQGGVTKSLLAVGSMAPWGRQKQPTSWIYMRTYMPPTFLTRLPSDAASDAKTCSNHDEQGLCNQASHDSFGRRLDDACQKEEVYVVDLKGSSLKKLNGVIQTELACSDQFRGSRGNVFLYLVAPDAKQDGENHYPGFSLSPAGREGHFQLSNETYAWHLISSHGPHLTTEDFPPFGGSLAEFYNMLTLNVYNISCAEIV